MPTNNKAPKRERKPFKLFRMSPESHHQLRVLAALKRVTLEEAHDKYALPALTAAVAEATKESRK